MNKQLFLVSALVAFLGCAKEHDTTPVSESGDVVSKWNVITLNATKKAGYNSNLATRIAAIEALAVYDAANAIKHFGTPYHYSRNTDHSGASTITAVAQAAHDVLLANFPAQKTSLDSALSATLCTVKSGSILEGETVGAAAASNILAFRENDASSPNQTYAGPETPGIGVYQLTPTAFTPGINQQWGSVTPFVLQRGNQFRPAPPPTVGSDAYNAALNEVKELGDLNSTTRTEEQTHIAQFYKQDAELTVNETARQVLASHNASLEERSLVLALVDIAEADARIALFDAKYTYLFWRPVTALNASADGSVTNNYSAWSPLLTTPSHPDYPCGHCGTVTAGLEVLKSFYGDDNTVTLHTTTVGENARTLNTLSAIEAENGWSRVYGGIHYSFDNTAAQTLAQQVAAYVLEHGPKQIKN